MNFIELLKIVFLGIVEGITEWLPISSTGHMILVDEFLHLNVSDAFKSMFFVVIQLGAILAVVFIYWNKLFPFYRDSKAPIDKEALPKMWAKIIGSSVLIILVLALVFKFKSGLDSKFMKLLILLLGFIIIVSLLFYILSNLVKGVNVRTNRSQLIMWLKIVVACIPAGIVGVLFDDFIDEYLYNYIVVALALIIFGIFFIIIENKNKDQEPRVKTIDEITYKDALMIGLFQVLAAVFPGTSRSGATILGGIVIGLSRTIAAEFTFFLAVPVMLGASILKLAKFGLSFTMAEFIYLVVGMVVAFGVSIVVIKFLMNYIKKNDFKAFGWYRIILGILVLVYFFVKTILL